jgi:hypothetical protein
MVNILGPESMSEAALKLIRATLDIAVENRMIGQEDASKGMAILDVNPHRRLGLLGKRLARIQADVSEIKSISIGLESMAEECQEEVALLQKVIEWQPEWRPEDEETSPTIMDNNEGEEKPQEEKNTKDPKSEGYGVDC